MKKILFFLCVTTICFAQNLPKVAFGSIERIAGFQSKFVPNINIAIWIPEKHDPKKKYAVLYMHDGQMLFDPTLTWNKQAWEIDKVAGQLMQEGRIQDCIIVGIESTGSTRHATYFPQKPYESLTEAQKELVSRQLQEKGRNTGAFEPISDNYLQFIVTELKPYIDKNYSVLTDKNHTFIAGSSMGGLISMYALCEYPNVFGGAACLSTHWPGIFSTDNNPIPDAFVRYLQKKLPNPKTHKIYFDYGDQTLDALYPPLQKKVDEVMLAKGYTAKNWLTKFFPGKDHSEKSWNERIHFALEFLLTK